MDWDIILENLQKEIQPHEFNRYIKNITLDEKNSTDEIKIIHVNNIYVANVIKRNYAAKIALLFESSDKIKPEIKVIVKAKKQRKNTDTNHALKIITQNQKMIINPSYTFDTFIVGESNRFAFSVAQKVAQNQGNIYNPLFISSDTGLGKTHILNAIGNYNLDKKNIVLITSEDFTNDFVYHLQNKHIDNFREKYRKCDYLLIDDVQFFIGKPQIQEEFFHTFEVLKQHNKQIVLTSDKEIKYLNGIEDRLKSRFESGLVAQIQHPEIETKIAIIKKKCEIDLIQMNNEIINYIAININHNIRTIEGILTTINSYASIMNQDITLDFVKNIIKNYKKTNIEYFDLNDIIKITARTLNIKPSDIKSKKRARDVSFARKIVIHLARKLTKNSMHDLANQLEMKDHSSISKATTNIQKEMQNNESLRIKINEIENIIKDSKIN